MDDELARLKADAPLPAGWAEPEIFGDVIRLGRLDVQRVGLVSRSPSGEEVTGAAAQPEGSPVSRAWFELLERVALLDAADRRCSLRDAAGARLGAVARGCPSAGVHPTRRRARSNGVALHVSWDRACESARLELLERDRLMRAWLGELGMVPVEGPRWTASIDTHDWRFSRVAEAAGDAVVVAVAFPRASGVPLARGFAARRTLEDAVEAAAAEAVQNLAFIADEAVPERPPEPSPTPMFHLDQYLLPESHALLHRWLEGALARRGTPATDPPRLAPRFVDLTPRPMSGRLRVARAVDARAMPLYFGTLPRRLRRLLPPERHVHPIP